MGEELYLRLKIISGHNLKDSDTVGKSDPYAKIAIPGYKKTARTKTKKNTLNPKWNEEFIFKVAPNLDEMISIVVKDKDKLTSDDFLGKIQIDMNDIPREGDEVPVSNIFYDLKSKDLNSMKEGGQIQVYHAFIDTDTMNSRLLNSPIYGNTIWSIMHRRHKKKEKSKFKVKIDFSSGSSSEDENDDFFIGVHAAEEEEDENDFDEIIEAIQECQISASNKSEGNDSGGNGGECGGAQDGAGDESGGADYSGGDGDCGGGDEDCGGSFDFGGGGDDGGGGDCGGDGGE